MWTIEFTAGTPEGVIPRGTRVSNRYTLPQAILMVSNWHPRIRRTVRIVRA